MITTVANILHLVYHYGMDDETIDAFDVTDITGLTYRQLNHVIGTSRHFTQYQVGRGKARAFTFRDTVFLMVVHFMQKDNVFINKIDEAIDVIKENWKSDEPSEAGVITRWVDGAYRWSLYAHVLSTDDFSQSLDANIYLPNLFYNVRQMAYKVEGEFGE